MPLGCAVRSLNHVREGGPSRRPRDVSDDRGRAGKYAAPGEVDSGASKRRQIHVQRSEWSGKVTAPKGGRSRFVPMTDGLASALQAVRHLRGPRVLYRDEGTPPTNKVVRLWMQAAQRRAGLPVKNGGIHILRHTFCSHLAMQGAPAKAVQELARAVLAGGARRVVKRR